MGNIVAVALSLSTPRLWVLIKALMLASYRIIQTKRQGRRNRPRLMSQTVPSLHPPNSVPLSSYHQSSHEVVTITEGSHSELGAARDILRNTWGQLTTRPIRLSVHGWNRGQTRFSKCRSCVLTLGRNLLQYSANIITALILAIFLVGIFVAESSGSILSANIITNGVAVSVGTHCAQDADRCYGPSATIEDGCNPLYNYSLSYTWARDSHDNQGDMALTYADRCYGASPATDGCSYLYNQSISYTETSNDTCPFAGNVCLEGKKSALRLDTGLLEARYLGINSVERFHFRRSSTCAPLVADERRVKKIIDADGQATYNYYYGPPSDDTVSTFSISNGTWTPRKQSATWSTPTWKALNKPTDWTIPSFSKAYGHKITISL